MNEVRRGTDLGAGRAGRREGHSRPVLHRDPGSLSKSSRPLPGTRARTDPARVGREPIRQLLLAPEARLTNSESKFEPACLAVEPGPGPGTCLPRRPRRHAPGPWPREAGLRCEASRAETDARSRFAGPDGPARPGVHTAPHALRVSARPCPSADQRRQGSLLSEGQDRSRWKICQCDLPGTEPESPAKSLKCHGQHEKGHPAISRLLYRDIPGRDTPNCDLSRDIPV